MKFCYGHHKMAVMLFYGRWTSKILLFVLSSYFLYMAIVHGGFSIESQTKSRTVKDGSVIELSEEQLPSIPLSHTLEIGEMMRKFKEISAPLIHLKQHKGVPFSASFEKVEVTCKRYNLTELFKHFQFHIYKLLNLAVTLEHCVPVKSLLWVTVSNMDTYCHVHLANALRIFGYQFLNLNYDFAKRKNELPPGFRKLNSLIQNYHIWNKYEYVVFSDTSDVILTKCPSEVLTKIISWMERKQVDLLFNAAPYVWPSNDFDKKRNFETYNCSNVNATNPDHCFLNSGVWIAKSKNLLFYLQKTLSYHQEDNRKKNDILVSNSDQALYIELHRNFYPKVQIDVKGVFSRRFYLSNDKKHGAYGLGVNQCYLLPDPNESPKCQRISS